MVFYFYITQYPLYLLLPRHAKQCRSSTNATFCTKVHGAMFVFCLVDIFIFCFTKLHLPKIGLGKDFSKFTWPVFVLFSSSPYHSLSFNSYSLVSHHDILTSAGMSKLFHDFAVSTGLTRSKYRSWFCVYRNSLMTQFYSLFTNIKEILNQ